MRGLDRSDGRGSGIFVPDPGLALYLEERLLTIGDDSGSFQFVACSPGLDMDCAFVFSPVVVGWCVDRMSFGSSALAFSGCLLEINDEGGEM